LWSTKNWKYCSSSWFIYSVCLFVYRWKDVDNFVSIPSILFSFLVNSIINYSPLSEITLFSNLCNLYTLSLNNLASPSADVLFIIAIKWVIFDNLSKTTKIISFSTTNSNFVIKPTVRCVHSFFSTSFAINFSISVPVLFFILWHRLYIFIYFPTFFVTSGH